MLRIIYIAGFRKTEHVRSNATRAIYDILPWKRAWVVSTDEKGQEHGWCGSFALTAERGGSKPVRLRGPMVVRMVVTSRIWQCSDRRGLVDRSCMVCASTR